jgi:hypothetical protein
MATVVYRMEQDRRYWTQHAATPGELDDLIDERINEGWELFGDPYVAIHPEKDPLFCQAMVRGKAKAKTVTEKLRDDLGG